MIDDNDLSSFHAEENHDLETGEDAPIIAAVIDERPKIVQRLEEYKTSDRWAPVPEVNDGKNNEAIMNIQVVYSVSIHFYSNFLQGPKIRLAKKIKMTILKKAIFLMKNQGIILQLLNIERTATLILENIELREPKIPLIRKIKDRIIQKIQVIEIPRLHEKNRIPKILEIQIPQAPESTKNMIPHRLRENPIIKNASIHQMKVYRLK